MQWFRLYNEFAVDPKVQRMPHDMQRHLIMIFCYYSMDQLNNIKDDDVAYLLGVTDEEITSIKNIFIDRGFIDENWIPLNWEKRQTNTKSTQRVQKYRDKNSKLNGNIECNVRDVSCETSETHETPKIREDKSREDKTRKENNNAPAPAREDAEKIYSLYPKKTAPKKAKQSIEAAFKKIDADSLAQAVQEYAESVYVRSCVETGNKQFIPHPATWFNQERWDDDRDTWKIPCSEASKAGWKQDQPSQQKPADPIRDEIDKRLSFIEEHEEDYESHKGMIKARENTYPLHGKDLGFHNGSYAWQEYCRHCWENLGIDATIQKHNGREPPEKVAG